ncbi:RNA polymerase factor sigma-54 [Klebsiella pneumoniae]|nr:RNA polymerase factor sigma-54 [Klebsiella pneumoniae]
MKRKVIVACGGAVATSTMAAEEIKELCADHNIELDLVQCRVNEIETYMDGADLICTTARVERVAAKDLRDCLLIQLSQFAKETPWLEEARLIISDHLDLLANRIKTLDSLEDRFHLLQADLVIADAVDNIFNLNREVARIVDGVDYQDDELPVYQGETTQTLQDYLMWQVELTPFTDTDRAIATSIVDAVDDTGYLTIQIEDIVDSIGDDEIGLEEVEAVLKRIQRFDPVGVAAKDLRDCLLIQLSQFAKETPWLEEARLIISDHLDLLANHDFRTLMRVTRLKEEVLKEAVNLIQSLDPRPGQSIQTSEPEYVIPDVLVRKVSGRWTVELNADSIPRLKINQQYAAMGNSARNDADGQFIRSNLQEARWLIKSLESRNDTLLRVSRCIVEQQQAFFEQGEEYMKPMVLADIAQAVEMHESTISRVTTQKYLHSPRGIFELKYFFSSHVNTEGGGEASSTAIRALVKKLIAAENPAKPLSDSKLTSMLSEQGIMVARRTVAKYRESLSIPPSNQRKQLV